MFRLDLPSARPAGTGSPSRPIMMTRVFPAKASIVLNRRASFAKRWWPEVVAALLLIGLTILVMRSSADTGVPSSPTAASYLHREDLVESWSGPIVPSPRDSHESLTYTLHFLEWTKLQLPDALLRWRTVAIRGGSINAMKNSRVGENLVTKTWMVLPQEMTVEKWRASHMGAFHVDHIQRDFIMAPTPWIAYDTQATCELAAQYLAILLLVPIVAVRTRQHIYAAKYFSRIRRRQCPYCAYPKPRRLTLICPECGRKPLRHPPRSIPRTPPSTRSFRLSR